MQLTERAKQLIPLARIVSFEAWKNHYSAELIEIFQQADDQGRYLTDQDLEQIAMRIPESSSALEFARLLRDKADTIIDSARQKVLDEYSGITNIDGDLYPPARAQACWRDFWHFLRCITYGIAGSCIPFTSSEGLNNMQLLYQELQVPLPAMIVGLESLKTFGLEEFNPEQQIELSSYFNHLIEAMRRFQ
jgi:hypothetical protein